VTAFYNEIDPYAAQWLRNLIAAGHIADGVVDERSIEDIKPKELHGFTQCHFFAGIGVWSLALRSAGWPDDRPVWTGSCPCQPFSAAGKGGGFDDERHLWPAFNHLIEQCEPSVVIGEQVASSDAAPWLDLVQTDLEALGYAFGAVPFPSASVGAPHIRDRLYWVAESGGERLEGFGLHLRAGRLRPAFDETGRRGEAGRLDNNNNTRLEGLGVGHSPSTGWQGAVRPVAEAGWTEGRAIAGLRPAAGSGEPSQRPSPTNGHWRAADWLLCRDGKWRPVEPGTFPLAHGAAARVGRLRAYGNAINAKAAQAFIEAYLGD